MNRQLSNPVYFDHAATTPVAPDVCKEMMTCLGSEGNFANPSSIYHVLGLQAHDAVEYARFQVAELIAAEAHEIIFTSGATESNNIALRGVLDSSNLQGKHIITSKIEHPSVLQTCKQLERNGVRVSYLDVDINGQVALDDIINELTNDTILVSIMHVNNEVGVIQNIEEIAFALKEKAVLFHVDAAQSAGKVAIDLSRVPVDLMSFSAHKIYGPKGIGALYIRSSSKIKLNALMTGGGQEGGIRSGTLATHQIVGMGRAFAIAKDSFKKDYQHICALNMHLKNGLQEIPGVKLNACLNNTVPNIVSVSFSGLFGKEIMESLPEIAISLGSACGAGKKTPSYVLQALGYSKERANSSLRISLGRYTLKTEVDFLLMKLKSIIKQLNPKQISGEKNGK